MKTYYFILFYSYKDVILYDLCVHLFYFYWYRVWIIIVLVKITWNYYGKYYYSEHKVPQWVNTCNRKVQWHPSGNRSNTTLHGLMPHKQISNCCLCAHKFTIGIICSEACLNNTSLRCYWLHLMYPPFDCC